MPDNTIILSDRIKQYSLSTGTGDIALHSSAAGFSDFNTVYSHGDSLFYAVTDGSNYEIGSGVFNTGISGDFIERFPFRSSNNNSIIDFPAGTKEIYVTYPATHSVYIGSGVGNLNTPQSEGVAFWDSNNVLDYDSNIIWKKSENRLGIVQPSPNYGIDIGGDARTSSISASGFYVGSSGIYFPSGNNGESNYVGGRQLTHYEMNQLDDYAYSKGLISQLTGTSEVIELSGDANQYFLFKKQDSGTVFAGPPSGCSAPCSPAFPSFRQLVLDDFPFLMQASGYLQSDINTVSGALRSDLTAASGALQLDIDSVSGALRSDLTAVSGISQYGYDSSGILRSDLTTVSGISQNAYDITQILNDDLLFVSGLIPYVSGVSNYDDPGNSGQVVFDDSYVYFHVPSGDSPTGLVWKRAEINIW